MEEPFASRCIGLCIRVSSLIAALMLLVVGGAHLQSSFNQWCPEEYTECFGPWLFWDKDSFFTSTNQQLGNTYFGPNYGKVFTLDPTMLCTRWGPLFLGIAGALEHVAPAATGLPYKSPGGMVMWHLVMALFVAFPCGGNWGVLTGFACLWVCCIVTIGSCFDLRSQPLTFGHYSDSFLFRILLACSSVSCARFLVPAMKSTSLVTAILVIVVGGAHLSNLIDSWCTDADPVDYTCAGPWLFFNHDDFFKESKNCYSSLDHCQAGLYGSVFTIDPKTASCVWMPLGFGLWAAVEHVKAFSPGLVTTPGRALVFHAFVMFFVGFPCAGNFGIVVACWCSVPLLLSFLMIVFCPTQSLEVNFSSSDAWVPDRFKYTQDAQYHQLEVQEANVEPGRGKRFKHARHSRVVVNNQL
eukprot:TRINITY_DN1663_c0_g1_i12.p1 TRINITY_DN1663_c0_g1~~TRINITY_DN1663_c0_g1_i12.p1  ORF type:complete len:411 (-),score=69.34 TRINITY_DN1663_c0_g1_i12:359-1591(-)